MWTEDSSGVQGHSEFIDRFGSSWVTGDFDGDGYGDLVVGVPGEDFGAINNAGSVHVLYGTSDGLSAAGDQLWTQSSGGVASRIEPGDGFGSTLATGDFNGDGRDDLAVNVLVGPRPGLSGAVLIWYGSDGGLIRNEDYWSQDSPGIKGATEHNDRFGEALAAGDFDGDGVDDLAIGTAGENFNRMTNAGAVNVIYGTDEGLTAAGSQAFTQSSPNVVGRASDRDYFGYAFGVGDFGGDGFDDLLITAAGESVRGRENAGGVNLIFGSNRGLARSRGRLYTEATAGIATAPRAGEVFGF